MKTNKVITLSIVASGLLLVLCATAFSMGLGNQPPAISSVAANPNPTSPGARTELTCIASDPDGQVTQYVWTADGGTFPNGTTTQTVSAPVNTIVWTAPLVPGYYNITVTAYDNGGGFEGSPASDTEYLTILVDGANNSPVITSLIPEANSVFLGTSIYVYATATDSDGDPITFSWSASGGTISGEGDADPEVIVWTAPQTGGDYVITVTVVDDWGGQSTRSVIITVTVAHEAGYIRTPFANPVRVTSDDFGQIYVSDTHRDRILVYDAFGNFLQQIGGISAPLGLTVGPGGKLYVGEDGTDSVSMYSTSGSFLGTFSGPSIEMPNSIDLDPSLGKVFVVDTKAAEVLVFDVNGAFQYGIDGSSAVSGGFVFPVGVGVDTATQTLYVIDGGTYEIYGLDYAGNLRSRFGSMGRSNGQFSRPQGVTVDGEGRVFAVDAYQSHVQAFDSGGRFLARVGGFGTRKGELSVPLDVHVDQYNRLLVTSNDNSRIEVYALDEDVILLPNTEPTAPVPHLPGDGAEVYSYNPSLSVLPATDEDDDELSYDFEVYEIGQSEPCATVTDIAETPDRIEWSVEPGLNENTFYEWRARASDGVAVGPWTSMSSFYVNVFNESPTTPAVILIEPGAELRPDHVLSWAASSDPDALDRISYILEIDDDPDFSSVLIHEEGIRPTSISLESLAQYYLLVDDTLYYWRVKAADNRGGESSWIEGSFYFNRIEIEVSTMPEGAKVYIDGTPAYPGWRAGFDTTPLTVVNVKETRHIVTVVLEDYEAFTAIADNRDGADAEIVTVLSPDVPVYLDHPVTIPADQITPGETLSRSRPFLVDWNFDGTLDVLISDGSGVVHSVLGGDIPSYEGILLDPELVFGVPIQNAVVFAVDWDNDADFDLLMGNADGTVLLALNTGDQETPNFIDGGNIQVLGQDIWLVADSAPAVADWDNDGRKDLLVGSMTGTIGLYINTGTDEAPEFEEGWAVETEDGRLEVPRHSVPLATDWNDDGFTDLLVGSECGQIYLYLNYGAPGTPDLHGEGPINYFFNILEMLEANTGPFATPYLADWDGDGYRDLISGTEIGDIVVFPRLELQYRTQP